MLETCSILIFIYHSDILLSPSTNRIEEEEYNFIYPEGNSCARLQAIVCNKNNKNNITV